MFLETERQTRILTRIIHPDTERTVTATLRFSDQATLMLNGVALTGNLRRPLSLALQPGANRIELRMTGDNLAFT